MKRVYLLIVSAILDLGTVSAQNVNYTSLHTPATFNRSLNVNLPVGSIKGEGGVSGSGASTYSIPIGMPTGTNGVVPSITLEYNSQRGTDLLGMGWGISGLSYISRTHGTVYHDGSACLLKD